MKEQEQRIAIARSLGFKISRIDRDDDGEITFIWCDEYPKQWEGKSTRPWLPDFTKDLNAMHEAEKVLIRRGLKTAYVEELARIAHNDYISQTGYEIQDIMDSKEVFEILISMPAPMRAEACCKTLNLWTQTKKMNQAQQEALKRIKEAERELKEAERELKEARALLTQAKQEPWEPQHGPYNVTSSSSFNTQEEAQRAHRFFTFYKFLYQLAKECNAKHAPNRLLHYGFDYNKGKYMVLPYTRPMHTNCLFSSRESAQEACDIMNRDGWELPSL